MWLQWTTKNPKSLPNCNEEKYRQHIFFQPHPLQLNDHKYLEFLFIFLHICPTFYKATFVNILRLCAKNNIFRVLSEKFNASYSTLGPRMSSHINHLNLPLKTK